MGCADPLRVTTGNGRRAWVAVMTVVALAFSSNAAAQGGGAEPGRGKLLVASEALLDPNFARTVVLMLDHGDSGSAGLVLNRPSSVPIETLLPGVEGIEALDEPFFVGGPVELHKLSMLFETAREHNGHLEVLDGVFAGWDDELFEDMLNRPVASDRFRLYAGHAGWAPGQLEAEIAARAWYVLPASRATVFGASPHAGEDLWREMIRSARSRIASIRGAAES